MGKFEIEDNVFPEFFFLGGGGGGKRVFFGVCGGGGGGGGANMVYYGRCGNGKHEKIRNPGENMAQ